MAAKSPNSAASPSEPTGFTHLGIDTSALVGAGWPHPSVDLRNVMLACVQLGIPVLIPELVLWEAETISLQKTRDSINAADVAFQKASGRMPSFEFNGPKWPDRPSQRKAYSETVSELENEWKWSVVPLPKVSLGEAVMRAVRHEPPFANADSGFRDSLIVWSLLEQLQPGSVLGLIASDNAFLEARIGRAATGAGVSFTIFKTPDEAWEATAKMVRASSVKEVLAYWEHENARLTVALEQDRERLEAFIRENLRIPETPFGVSGYINAVRDVRVIGVIGAHVAFGSDKEDTGPGAHASVNLKVEVMLTSYRNPPPRQMRVGQTADDVSRLDDAIVSTDISELDAVATVAMQVVWPEDKNALPQIEYTAVEFGTPAEQLARRMALRELMNKK